MRKLGAEGAEQPEGFMSNAGWKVLQAYYQEEAKKNAPAPVAPQVEAKKEEPAP